MPLRLIFIINITATNVQLCMHRYISVPNRAIKQKVVVPPLLAIHQAGHEEIFLWHKIEI